MALRNLVDKMKPTFEKGGRLEWLHSTFDAFETFLYVPNRVTRKGSVHVKDPLAADNTPTWTVRLA